MKKRLVFVLLGIMALTAAISCVPAIRGDRDTVFMISSISALNQGVFDGDMTIGELKRYGDCGVGTFEDLNGELIVIDGNFLRARLDGTIEEVSKDTRVPWGTLTFFDYENVYNLDKALDLDGLKSYLDGLLPTVNYFYAIRLDGKFSYMKTRSMPTQQEPFPTLSEAARGQQIREFNDVEGTIISFRCPPYVEGVNVPGYHLHFIDKTRTVGGHILECKTLSARVTVDKTANMIMQLPHNEGFMKAKLGSGEPQGLKQVEQGKE